MKRLLTQLCICLLLFSCESSIKKKTVVEERHSNGNVKIQRTYVNESSWFKDSETYNSNYEEFWENGTIMKEIWWDKNGKISNYYYWSRDGNRYPNVEKLYIDGVKFSHIIYNEFKHESQMCEYNFMDGKQYPVSFEYTRFDENGDIVETYYFFYEDNEWIKSEMDMVFDWESFNYCYKKRPSYKD